MSAQDRHNFGATQGPLEFPRARAYLFLSTGEALMKIAQLAPLVESVPPRLYGGTERIVSYLTEELVRQGHDVTLFASGDSQTQAKLVACVPHALRLNPSVKDPLPYAVLQLEQLRQHAGEYDVVHFHSDFIHFP